jgi:hypothetical protein
MILLFFFEFLHLFEIILLHLMLNFVLLYLNLLLLLEITTFLLIIYIQVLVYKNDVLQVYQNH